MLTTLKKTTVHLLVIWIVATTQIGCAKKQMTAATATAADNTGRSATTTTEQISTAASAPAANLQTYAGRYDLQSDEISWAEVTVENNKLYGESDGRPKTELINEGGDKFKVQGTDATVTFTRDSQQQINGLVIYYQGNEIKGQKVK